MVISLFLFFSIWQFNLTAQEIRFSHIGVREGMSHSWAKSIEKDKQGFLWVGTINGLNRYDGKNFKIFKHDANNPSSLTDNFIQTIESDSRGNIWVGTFSGGAVLFDPKTEKFKSFRNSPKKLHTISDDKVHSIFEDSKGRLWVGTAKGLDIFDYEKQQFNQFYVLKENQPQFVKGIIASISEDVIGNIWVGTNLGLYKINDNAKTIKKYIHQPNNPKSLSHPYVTSVYQDENEQIWVGTWGGGLNLFEPSTESFRVFSYEEGLSNNSILCITGDKNGNVFVGTEGGGLNRLTLQNNSIEHYSPEIGNKTSLNSNSVHSMFFDHKTGLFWVGTYHGGLNFFSQWDKPFQHYKLGLTQLNNSNVLCIDENPNGNIYVGTDGGGVNIINKDKKSISQLMHDENNPYSLLNNAVLSILHDSKGNLWVGTFSGGLDFLAKGKSKFQHFTNDTNDPESLSDNDVSAICETSNGEIWIGTMDGGLNIYNPTTHLFTIYKHIPGDPTSISDNFISYIFEGKNGHLFIQTGKSLDEFDPVSGRFSRFDQKFGIKLDMPITSLEDSKGNIWVGTTEHLVFFDRKTLQYTRFTKDNGLPSSHITGILEDDNANIWISTMKGLAKFNNAVNTPNQSAIQIYSEEDGLQGSDFKDHACYKGKNGMLYFGGQNGLNAFNPNLIHLNPIPPTVALTGFKLFNKEVAFGKGELLDAPINITKEINLTYRQNVFSFEFTSLNFWLPNKNEYAYKMDGFDEDWNQVGKQSIATYTNLNPGKYTFKVLATNNDGIWSESEKQISIVISPPWWKTIWFQTLAFLILVAGLITFNRVRLYNLRQRQKELKLEVEIRTKEIRKINLLLKERNDEILHKNDSLTGKNEQLVVQNEALETQSKKIQNLLKEIQGLNEMKIRFFTNISHELRTPLTLILGPIEKLLAKSKLDKSSPKEFGLIQRNAVKLMTLINQLLDFRKIETGNIHLQTSKNDIVSCTREVFDSFQFIADKKKIVYHFDSIYPHYDLWFDLEKMERILTNLLSNAFKHTPDLGSIHVGIEIKKNQDFIEITVADSGDGIPADQQEHIFDLYFQATNASDLHQAGTGIGLSLIKQYVDLHHGTIHVASELGKGTTFRVRFLVGSRHLTSSETSINIPMPMMSDHLDHPLGEPRLEIEAENSHLTNIPEEKPLLLIVEDNADIRDYIKESLEDYFQITEASDGKDGLEKALFIIPDLIISDVMMPEMNGFIMCKQLKKNEVSSHIPIVLLTAYSGEEKQWEGFKSGADDYVTKPFNIKILQQKLMNITYTRRQLIDKFSQSTTLDIQKLTNNAADNKFLNTALDIINENLTNTNFGVVEFSYQFNMSRRNLLRKIKAITGLSVNEFIKNIRLKKSAELFNNMEMNVSEIAYAVGFSDPKYFSKCFKEQFGKSPSHFKDNLRD